MKKLKFLVFFACAALIGIFASPDPGVAVPDCSQYWDGPFVPQVCQLPVNYSCNGNCENGLILNSADTQVTECVSGEGAYGFQVSHNLKTDSLVARSLNISRSPTWIIGNVLGVGELDEGSLRYFIENFSNN